MNPEQQRFYNYMRNIYRNDKDDRKASSPSESDSVELEGAMEKLEVENTCHETEFAMKRPDENVPSEDAGTLDIFEDYTLEDYLDFERKCREVGFHFKCVRAFFAIDEKKKNGILTAEELE
ncbi:unnamed protein product [Calicophoron daubneyi]